MLTFEIVRTWLNWFDDERSFLHGSLRRLVERMRTAWENHSLPEVLRLIDLLHQTEDSLNDMNNGVERAEIRLECGRIYYEMGDYSRTATELRRARNFYQSSHPHNVAVVNWLLGCAFWRQAQQSDAIACWERSRRAFETMAKTGKHPDWYREQIEKMDAVLNQAIDDGRWPPPGNENS